MAKIARWLTQAGSKSRIKTSQRCCESSRCWAKTGEESLTEKEAVSDYWTFRRPRYESDILQSVYTKHPTFSALITSCPSPAIVNAGPYHLAALDASCSSSKAAISGCPSPIAWNRRLSSPRATNAGFSIQQNWTWLSSPYSFTARLASQSELE
jgi:hypothetical protein